MPTIEQGGKIYIEWDTPDFVEKMKRADIDQALINKAMVEYPSDMEAIHVDGKWYYAVRGLNRHFPLPEGRGWQD